jgi:hypothetical protein
MGSIAMTKNCLDYVLIPDICSLIEDYAQSTPLELARRDRIVDGDQSHCDCELYYHQYMHMVKGHRFLYKEIEMLYAMDIVFDQPTRRNNILFLTHVVRNFDFSCLSFNPLWLRQVRPIETDPYIIDITNDLLVELFYAFDLERIPTGHHLARQVLAFAANELKEFQDIMDIDDDFDYKLWRTYVRYTQIKAY